LKRRILILAGLALVMFLFFLISFWNLFNLSPEATTPSNTSTIPENQHSNIFPPPLYDGQMEHNKIHTVDHAVIERYRHREFNAIRSFAASHTIPPEILYNVAYAYFEDGQYDNALSYFLRLYDHSSTIKDHLCYKIALCYRGLRKWQDSIRYLTTLREQYPDSILLADALEKEAYSRINVEDFTTLAHTYGTLHDSETLADGAASIQQRLLFFSGSGYQRLGQTENALLQYFRILEYPHTNYSDAAVERIDYLLSQSDFEPSIKNRIHLAGGYYQLEANEKAEKLLQEIGIQMMANLIARPAPSELQYWWHKYSGLVDLRLNHYEDALFHFQAASILPHLERHYKDEMQFWVGKTHRLSGNVADALQQFDQIMEQSTHTFRKEATLQLVEMTFLQGKHQQGYMYARQLVALGWNDDLWDYFQTLRNRHDDIILLRYYPEIANSCSSGYSKTRFNYWLGMIALRNHQNRRAFDFLEESVIAYPFYYYSDKALEILRSHNSNPIVDLEGIKSRLNDMNQSFCRSTTYMEERKNQLHGIAWYDISDHHLKNALAFFEINEFYWADKELTTYLTSLKENRSRVLLDLSDFLKRSEFYQYSIRYAEQWLRHINNGYATHFIPRELVTYFYPKYYEDLVQKAAKRFDMDPHLIFSLIHQESRFYGQAHSHAGAMGLMQLMPATARDLARQERLQNYSEFDPETNISLGTRFFSQLLRQYTPDLALAAYNGGPGRISRWVRRFREQYHYMNDAHFVELIPIDETRKYVIKVMGVYAGYKWFYE
jgi:hypothetical protein